MMNRTICRVIAFGSLGRDAHRVTGMDTNAAKAAPATAIARVSSIGETVRGGGKVLIPSFALGRAQEITQILQTGMASGLMPQAPIYLDGLTRSVTEAYEGMLPLLPFRMGRSTVVLGVTTPPSVLPASPAAMSNSLDV